jgi:hypothetical protein
MRIFHLDALSGNKTVVEQTTRAKRLIQLIQHIIDAKAEDDIPTERMWILELAELIGVDATDSISVWAAAMDIFLSVAPVLESEDQTSGMLFDFSAKPRPSA